MLILLAAVLIHAAAGMPVTLVLQVQGVMLGVESQRTLHRGQLRIPALSPLLASAGLEILDGHADGHAGAAVMRLRTICECAAAPEPESDQLTVDAAVDQMAGCGDLRSRQPIRQIAAGVWRGRVELQRGEREVVELGHGEESAWAASFQACAGSVECTNRERCSANSLRPMGRAPKRLKCSVSCWQSINGTPRRWSIAARRTSATFDASPLRANIDSPKN